MTHPGYKPGVITFTAAGPATTISITTRSGHAGVETFAPFYPQQGRYVMGDVPLYGLAGPDLQRLDWFGRRVCCAIVG